MNGFYPHSTSESFYKPPIKYLVPVTFLLWFVISLFNTGVFVFSFEDEGPLSEFFYGLRWTPLYHSPWLIIIPCILVLAREFPLNRGISFKNLSTHLLAAVSITILTSFLHTYFIYIRLGEPFDMSSIPGNFIFYFVDRMLIYFVILLGYYAIDYNRKQNRESFKELKIQESINRQKLNSFKNNIQPAFLLNTLNDIEKILPKHPDRAEKLIADLAQMIRKLLNNSQKSHIQIEDDLHFLASYLSILGIRLNKVISFHNSVNRNEKMKDAAISLHVITVLEKICKKDIRTFDTVHKVEYEPFGTDTHHGINVRVERLNIQNGHFNKWLNRGAIRPLFSAVPGSNRNEGTVQLNLSEDGILHFEISYS